MRYLKERKGKDVTQLALFLPTNETVPLACRPHFNQVSLGG